VPTDSTRRILCSVAHPDDETFGLGSVLIKYVQEGADVYTACGTRGDVGEIHERSHATPETLAEVREQEYYAAGKTMGVTRSILYGYRDSGMAGTPENDHPNAYIKVPVDEVAAQIVETIREIRPHIVLTFDEGGGYGHPDHIHASAATVAAFHAAADPNYAGSSLEPWTASKLYYWAFPKSKMKEWIDGLKEIDPDSDLANLDPDQLGMDDDRFTTVLDTSKYSDIRRQAIAQHQSQYSPLDRMPSKELADMYLNSDFLIRAYPEECNPEETDLFEGLDI